MTHLLQVQQLNKSYKHSHFELNDISFTLNPGEVIGLIGKNGSGKSTLINTLVGNRFKDSGEISFFNQIISEKDKDYKEHVGVVFDDLRVPDKLTLQSINKVFTEIYDAWNSDTFFSLIKAFELPTNNQIKTFSRGMRMKAALTIALSHDAKLLILDEATAGMDVSGREHVLEILEDYLGDDRAILISSHISEDIEQLATQLVFMRDGRIILKESKEVLLSQYGIIDQPVEHFNISNEYLIATRRRNDRQISLVNNYQKVPDAQPLKTIDDATKIIMRGEV